MQFTNHGQLYIINEHAGTIISNLFLDSVPPVLVIPFTIHCVLYLG